MSKANEVTNLSEQSEQVKRLVSRDSGLLEKLDYLLTVEMAECAWFGLMAIVDESEVTGTRELNDSENDYFDHKYIEQWVYFEDDYHGVEYVPVDDGSGKYFKLEYTC